MEKVKVVIEKATRDDIEWIKSAIKKNGWKWSSLQHVLVAKIEKKPIGMARAEFFRNGELATIAGVFVEEEMRGMGIGLKLVKKIIETYSDTSEWHLAGKSWIEKVYEKIGFKKTNIVIPELKRDFEGQIFMIFKKQ